MRFRAIFLVYLLAHALCPAHAENVLDQPQEIASFCRDTRGDEEMRDICRTIEQIKREREDAYFQATMAAKKTPACTRLKPGENTLVHFQHDAASPTGLAASYRLTRSTENAFLVELRLRFAAGKTYSGGLANAQLNDSFQKLADSCLESFDGSLKNGDKRLRIRLSTDEKIPEQLILVEAKRIRSHSKAYAEDIDCPAILHEVLHLLGLPDEYQERKSGYIYDRTFGFSFDREAATKGGVTLNCRVPGPRNSIMSRHEEAATLAASMAIWEVDQCECPDNADCSLKAAESNGSACPPGTLPAKGEQYLMPGEAVYLMKNSRFFVLPQGEHRRKGIAAAQHSALLPSHFRAITEPACSDVNRCYFACAKNSQRFVDPEGRKQVIPNINYGCLEIPPECQGKCFD